MKRRIVLVAFPWTRDQDPPMPLGHASILAALSEEPMLDVRSIVHACDHGEDLVTRTVEEILSHARGVEHHCMDVGLGAYVWNDGALLDVMAELRRREFKGRIILGGPQVSYAGTDLEELYPNADVFVRGQAEGALSALARECNHTRIRGVHYAGEIDRCEQTESSIDTAPSPWLNAIPLIGERLFVRWETQRGCKFKCSFCQHRQPEGITPCSTFPEERILGEIDLFCRLGIKRIAVLDPIFNSSGPHAIQVLKEFASRGFRGELSLQCRPELIDKAFLDVAQNLNVCLEFGLQSIHAREYLAIGRPNNIKRIRHVLDDVRRRSIKHEVSLIYGLPEQTLDSFKATIRWCQEQHVAVIKAFPLLLLRGTALEQQRERFGLVVREEAGPMVVESNTFRFDDWKEMTRIADGLIRTHASEQKPHFEDWCQLAAGVW